MPQGNIVNGWSTDKFSTTGGSDSATWDEMVGDVGICPNGYPCCAQDETEIVPVGEEKSAQFEPRDCYALDSTNINPEYEACNTLLDEFDDAYQAYCGGIAIPGCTDMTADNFYSQPHCGKIGFCESSPTIECDPNGDLSECGNVGQCFVGCPDGCDENCPNEFVMGYCRISGCKYYCLPDPVAVQNCINSGDPQHESCQLPGSNAAYCQENFPNHYKDESGDIRPWPGGVPCPCPSLPNDSPAREFELELLGFLVSDSVLYKECNRCDWCDSHKPTGNNQYSDCFGLQYTYPWYNDTDNDGIGCCDQRVFACPSGTVYPYNGDGQVTGWLQTCGEYDVFPESYEGQPYLNQSYCDCPNNYYDQCGLCNPCGDGTDSCPEWDACVGCTDYGACNYSSDFTIDDGSCLYVGDDLYPCDCWSGQQKIMYYPDVDEGGLGNGCPTTDYAGNSPEEYCPGQEPWFYTINQGISPDDCGSCDGQVDSCGFCNGTHTSSGQYTSTGPYVDCYGNCPNCMEQFGSCVGGLNEYIGILSDHPMAENGGIDLCGVCGGTNYAPGSFCCQIQTGDASYCDNKVIITYPNGQSGTATDGLTIGDVFSVKFQFATGVSNPPGEIEIWIEESYSGINSPDGNRKSSSVITREFIYEGDGFYSYTHTFLITEQGFLDLTNWTYPDWTNRVYGLHAEAKTANYECQNGTVQYSGPDPTCSDGIVDCDGDCVCVGDPIEIEGVAHWWQAWGFYDSTNYPYGNFFKCAGYGGGGYDCQNGLAPTNGFIVVQTFDTISDFYVDLGPDRVVSLDNDFIILSADTDFGNNDVSNPTWTWDVDGGEYLTLLPGVCVENNEGNQCVGFQTPTTPGIYRFKVSVLNDESFVLGTDSIDIEFKESNRTARSQTNSNISSKKITKIDKYNREHKKVRNINKSRFSKRSPNFNPPTECGECDYYMNGTLSGLYQCGNFNGDTALNILDVVGMINYVLDSAGSFDDCDTYLESPFPIKCLKLFMDMGNDGQVNVLDIIDLVNRTLSGYSGNQECAMVYHNATFRCCDGTYVNHRDLCVNHGGAPPGCPGGGEENLPPSPR